jgi:hypothetical protein
MILVLCCSHSPGTDDLIKAFSSWARPGECGLEALEIKMTTVKSLAIVALLVGGTSLAMAQSGPPTGGQPPVAGGAAGNPAAPGPNLQAATPSRHATKHHKKMYMSAKSTTHKHKQLKPAPETKAKQ